MPPLIKIKNGNSGREITGYFGELDDPRTRIAKLRTQVAHNWNSQRKKGNGMAKVVSMYQDYMLGLRYLREEIENISERFLQGEFYRASKAGGKHASEDSADYFLPPPAILDGGIPKREGRFNDVGSRALYLASQRDILPGEMTQDGKSCECLIAKFLINLNTTRIANLLPNATSDLPHVNALIGEAERIRSDDSIGTPNDPYAHTIFLRHELESARFQGAIYPSVHDNYKDDPDGYNLVIFDKSLFEKIIIDGWQDEVSREEFKP